jgi:GNAT superfamily N-acetyltransferase
VIRLRRATPADCERIATLHAASIRALGSTHYAPEQLASWSAHTVPERYLPSIEAADFLVALDGEQIVGFGELHEGEIGMIFVDPASARRGIGSMLLRELEQIAAARSVERLTLCASLNAVPFYSAMGFTPVEKVSWRSPGGLELPCLHMEKRLPPAA